MAGIIVIGTGPGIGTSVARRFGSTGMPVGLVARTQGTIDAGRDSLVASGVERVAGVTADAASEDGLRTALDQLVERHGVPETLVYNAGLIRSDRPGELDHAALQQAYAVNVLGAVTAATHLAPAMADAGGGSILLTGGMPRPVATVASLSLGKVALRALTSMLADELGPTGIHVATVTVHGTVAPGGPFDPDTIAEKYWHLHQQPLGDWQTLVDFTGTPG